MCTLASHNMVMIAPAPRTPKIRGKVVDISGDVDGVLPICARPTTAPKVAVAAGPVCTAQCNQYFVHVAGGREDTDKYTERRFWPYTVSIVPSQSGYGM